MNKRYGNKWSATLGGGYTMAERLPERLPAEPEPAGRGRSDDVELQGVGLYDAPSGIRISPVLRHQSGANYARTITLTVAGSASPGGHATTPNRRSQPRRQHLGVRRPRARRAQLNSRVRIAVVPRRVQHDQQPRVGDDQPRDRPGYQKPSAILAPSTARVGFRFIC